MRCLSNTTDSCRNDAYHASGLLDKATSMVHADARVSAREIKKFGFFCFILRFFLIKFKGFNLCRNNAWHAKGKNVVCICSLYVGDEILNLHLKDSPKMKIVNIAQYFIVCLCSD